MPEIPMRTLALTALIGASLFAVGAAEAQERLILNVKPRSWLDAGTQVQVGSMQGYVYDQQGSRDTARFGARGSNSGFGPTRPGEGITFETPATWSVR
jgi:hypothetical protein